MSWNIKETLISVYSNKRCFTFEQKRHEWNNRWLQFANTNPICSVIPAWINEALELRVQLAEL